MWLRGKPVWAVGQASGAEGLDGDEPDEHEDEAVEVELASGIG